MNVSLDFSCSDEFGANRERLSRASVETSSNKHLELSIEALMAAATETLMEVFDLTIRREIEEKRENLAASEIFSSLSIKAAATPTLT